MPTTHPEPTAWSLSNRAYVELIVDKMLEVLHHGHLPHELVLVSIHASQSTNVHKNV
jgi:hypothetical protein